ncbi:RebB family R body protein [Gynuella sp.]|uniref:RebB family R body protein n=1 Tax=Gynuella sp. TaxID=2969146 RepID=UPI003D12A90E
MMTQPSSLNGAVVGSVAATNAQVNAVAPAMAMGSLYQTIGNSVAMGAANAVYAQQQGWMTYQSTGVLGVTKLFSDNKS